MKKLSYYLLYHRFSVFFLTAAVVMLVIANEQLIKISPSLEKTAMGMISRIAAKNYGLLNGGRDPILHAWFGNGTIGADAISEVVSLKEDFTVEVIAKPDKKQGTNAHIIGNHPGYKYFEGFAMQQDGDNQNVYTFGFGNGKQWLPPVRFRLTAEEWNYLAIVVKNNQIEVYKNGFLVTSGDAGDSIKNSEMPILLGNGVSHDRPFNGNIYEVKILNHTLSKNDIRRNWKRIKEKMNIDSKLAAKKSGLLKGERDPVLHAWFGKGVIGADIISEVHDLKRDFTVEVIVKPGKKQGIRAHIIGNHPGYRNFEGFALQQDGDKQNVYTFGFGNGKQWLPPVRFRLTAEEWNYLAIVVKNNQIRVYKNGLLLTSGDAGDSIKNSEMPIWVGNWVNHDRPFKGNIFEVRILNYALSENDMRLNWKRIKEKLM